MLPEARHRPTLCGTFAVWWRELRMLGRGRRR